MSARHTLLMPLVGPMQSWGYRSRFDDRDTGLEPTRSGILGLLCAACGIPRNDTETLRELNDALRIGVRIDAPGRVMVDFHTAKNVLIRAVRRDHADERLPERQRADGAPRRLSHRG